MTVQYPWYLAVGVLIVAFAIYGLLTGRAIARGFHVSRNAEPFWFWTIIAIELCLGLWACRAAFAPAM